MKIQIKLDRDAALGYKNFVNTVKPKDMDEDEFVKIVFFNGVEATNKQLEAQITKYMEEHPDELAQLKDLHAEKPDDTDTSGD